MILYRLQRHPIVMRARLRHVLVLSYALPARVLRTLVPAGMTIETIDGQGLLAVAMVRAERMRPAGLPPALGRTFFLCGYRVFVRLRTESGRSLRGLHIIRSETDRRSMAWFGNLFTHYRYRLAAVRFEETRTGLDVAVRTPGGEADLDVSADLSGGYSELPAGSPFADWKEARRFAGPLPYTFDYEAETGSVVLIRAERGRWRPRPVDVDVRRCAFVERLADDRCSPVLASASYIESIDYQWNRGVVTRLWEDAA